MRVAAPLLVVATLGARSLPAPDEATPSTAIAIDSVEVLTPCAERIIIRNRSGAALTVHLRLERKRTRIAIRGRELQDSGSFRSAIRTLPAGGASGTVEHAGAELRFDSRQAPPCIGPIRGDLPELAPDDYRWSNDALSARSASAPGSAFPGLVLVMVRRSADRAAVEALFVRHRASVVAEDRSGGVDSAIIFTVFIDGDHPNGTKATRLATELRRSPHIQFAGAYLTLAGIGPA